MRFTMIRGMHAMWTPRGSAIAHFIKEKLASRGATSETLAYSMHPKPTWVFTRRCEDLLGTANVIY